MLLLLELLVSQGTSVRPISLALWIMSANGQALRPCCNQHLHQHRHILCALQITRQGAVTDEAQNGSTAVARPSFPGEAQT